MVRNVFRLDDRPLTSLMVPRSDVAWLDAGLTVAEGLRMAGSGGEQGAHSWYPVCRGSLDEVVGLLSVARLLELGPQAQGLLERHAQPAAFLPETLSGMELLEQFRARSGRMVFVVDEYGVVQGIMTPRDLLEPLPANCSRARPRTHGPPRGAMAPGCSTAWCRWPSSRRGWIFGIYPVKGGGAITPWPAF